MSPWHKPRTPKKKNDVNDVELGFFVTDVSASIFLGRTEKPPSLPELCIFKKVLACKKTDWLVDGFFDGFSVVC